MEVSSANHLIGGLAAILSAFCWAVSALLFAQISHDLKASTINFAKGVIAIVCLLAFALPIPFANISTQEWVLLSLSGLLGIALGDTLYFLTLKQLGARLTLLLSTLIPVVTAIAAILLFQESLTWVAGFGLLLTLGSVIFVMWSKAERKSRVVNFPLGLSLGMLFIATEASAILITKAVTNSMDSVLVTFLRQVAGIAGITFWILMQQDALKDLKNVVASKNQLPKLIMASVVGAVLGTWLSVYALKMTYASVAVILNSISPLFIIPLSIWFLKEKVAHSSKIGAFFAVIGVGIYFVQVLN